VPLVFYASASGMEIVGPLALIVLGGLVTTALLNLLVLPALYLRFAARPRPTPAEPAGPAPAEPAGSAPAEPAGSAPAEPAAI
jgi:hypothetical protein